MAQHLRANALSKTNAFYIPSLDGMRAIAFLMVFLSHAGLGHFIPGGLGVTVFFFISGYLITSLLRREYETTQAINLKYFYIRRIFRIWPAFYLVLFFGAGLTMLGFLEGEIKLSAFLSQCLHVTNYYAIFFGNFGMTGGSGVYWSLGVEEHFYLIFPLLYIYLLRSRIQAKQQLAIFLGLCACVLMWRCVLIFGWDANEVRTFYATDTRLDSLLFGCALAVYANPIFEPEFFSERVIKAYLLPLGIVLVGFSLIYRAPEFRETFRYTLQGIGLFPIFVAAILFPNWGIFKVLNLKWVRFVGVLSYSLYLVHFTVIQAVNHYFHALSAFELGGLSFVITFALAYLIYQWIEMPFGRMRKHFTPA